MTKVTNTRNAANNNSTSKGESSAEHFLNYLYKGTNVQSHYGTIDNDPESVAKCQADPDFANRYYGNEYFDVVYRQKGVTSKPKLVRNLDAI